MAEIRRYVWIFPFLGSIIAIIGVFTPAAVTFSGLASHLYWMHGFYLNVGGGYPDPGFYVDFPGLMAIGIVSMILIIVCTIVMFISSLTHRGVDAPGSWLAIGILLIGGTIFFIGGAELAYRIHYLINSNMFNFSFWDNRTPGFAVIAPFIAGGLSILGYIVSKAARTGEVEIIPISKATTEVKETPSVEKETAPPAPPSGEDFRFCPECGQEISSPEDKFCLSCGFEFKKA